MEIKVDSEGARSADGLQASRPRLPEGRQDSPALLVRKEKPTESGLTKEQLRNLMHIESMFNEMFSKATDLDEFWKEARKVRDEALARDSSPAWGLEVERKYTKLVKERVRENSEARIKKIMKAAQDQMDAEAAAESEDGEE